MWKLHETDTTPTPKTPILLESMTAMILVYLSGLRLKTLIIVFMHYRSVTDADLKRNKSKQI